MKRILSALLILILGTLLAYCIVDLTYSVFGVGAFDILGESGYILVLVIFVLLGILLFHVGSVLGGLMTGWKLAEFSLFGFGLHRDSENHLRLMYRQSPRPLSSLMTPPCLDGSSPFGGIYAGTLLLIAASGAVLMLLACLLSAIRIMPAVFLLGGFLVMMSLLFAFRIVPLLLRLRRNVHLRRAYEVNALTGAATRRGLSVTSLPEDAFVPFPEEALTNPQAFVAQCNICTRRLNDGDYALAFELLQQLSEVLQRTDLRLPNKPVYSQMMILSLAIAEMMTGAEPRLSERLYDDSMKLLNHPGWHERLLLARYLRALLVTKDETDAANHLVELNVQLESLPEVRTIGTRRILADAQALAAERNMPHA